MHCAEPKVLPIYLVIRFVEVLTVYRNIQVFTHDINKKVIFFLLRQHEFHIGEYATPL